jgi:hypothetical protein
MAKDSTVSTLALAVIVLIALNWKSMAKGKQPGQPQSAQGGCGCDSCNSAAQMNATIPINPTAGNSTSSGTGRGSLRNGYVSGGNNQPGAAPGGNSTTPGSGGNWQGLRTHRATGLTPASAPNAPYMPTGSGVWVANATPAVVHGGAH